MDLMKRIARKHNFAVLLHEKPYSGVNGSGKTQQLVTLH
jgi:glutamine synthetase